MQALGKARDMPADAQLPAPAPAPATTPAQPPNVNVQNDDRGIVQPGNSTMASLHRLMRKLSK